MDIFSFISFLPLMIYLLLLMVSVFCFLKVLKAIKHGEIKTLYFMSVITITRKDMPKSFYAECIMLCFFALLPFIIFFLDVLVK